MGPGQIEFVVDAIGVKRISQDDGEIVMDDLMNNATLTAMLAYLAADDPEKVSRERRSVMPRGQRGQSSSWPECRDGARAKPR